MPNDRVKIWTVADLVNDLAGLPPMAEVFISITADDGFVRSVRLKDATDQRSPIVVIECGHALTVSQYEVYEEQVARKRQQAMQMAHNMQQAEKMPPMAE